MKRDYITTGRRPTGIIGAALLAACRLHNHKRSQKQVSEVMRICDMTLSKRVSEFLDTPGALMTEEELIAYSAENDNGIGCDPPSFVPPVEDSPSQEQLQQAIASTEFKETCALIEQGSADISSSSSASEGSVRASARISGRKRKRQRVRAESGSQDEVKVDGEDEIKTAEGAGENKSESSPEMEGRLSSSRSLVVVEESPMDVDDHILPDGTLYFDDISDTEMELILA